LRPTVTSAVLASLACWAIPAQSQATAASAPQIFGTWRADLKDEKRTDAPRIVIVRDDSSASYGEETVRWRLKPDSIMLALGGEWVTYHLKVRGDKLTLSAGDLAKPVTLTRSGPPTPRPPDVAVPPDPDVGQ
jgi:hypothetical protein